MLNGIEWSAALKPYALRHKRYAIEREMLRMDNVNSRIIF